MKNFIDFLNEAIDSKILELKIDNEIIPYKINVNRIIADEPALRNVEVQLNKIIKETKAYLILKNKTTTDPEVYTAILNNLFKNDQDKISKIISKYKTLYPKSKDKIQFILMLIDLFKSKAK